MCGGRVLLTGTRGGADVKREPGLSRAGGVSAQPTRPTSRRGCVGGGYNSVAHGAGPTSNGNRVSAGRWWCVRSTNTPYVLPRMCGGRVLLSGTRGGADVEREPGLRRALVVCPLNQHTLRSAADVWGAGITEWHTGRG